MSFDLYFYKQKRANLSSDQIAKYLTDNLCPINESDSQWFYENPDTEVYYSFDQNEPKNDSEAIDESFADFDNTHFSFNLNFMRPSFFGLEAFQFIEQMIADLNLYLLNPQSNLDSPQKETKNQLFENWNITNLLSSSRHFEELQGTYIPIEKSNRIWEYNFNRARFQNELGEQYFVPKMFFFKTKKSNEAVTITTWTEHIPNVIPYADYFLLSRQYKKFFRVVKDSILVSQETILKIFGSYFDDFKLGNCKIIHPNNAAKVKDIFNSLKAEQSLADFAERLSIEYLYNAKP